MLVCFCFVHSTLHIRQIKETKTDWIQINEKDKLMNDIIGSIYVMFAKDQSNGKSFENIKDDLASIMAAADYLAEMKVENFNDLTKKLEKRKKFQIDYADTIPADTMPELTYMYN